MKLHVSTIEPLEPRLLFAGTGTAKFDVVNLVSNGGVDAERQDLKLINPWGLAAGPTGPWWVANAGSNTSSGFESDGKQVSPVIRIPAGDGGPASVTGVAYNDTGGGFVIEHDGNSAPATYIFAGEGGTIAAWNADVRFRRAITVVDNSSNIARYKGVAIAEVNDEPYIYAANFYDGTIEVYDGEFEGATLKGSFEDPDLPAGYAPFNIQRIGNRLLVVYAEQDGIGYDELPGRGNGFVNVFRTNGRLVKRLISRGRLDAPWGLALAPSGFGKFSRDLLVGNFGDGRINAYNPDTGELTGTLKDADGDVLEIEGLWGIAFGNGDAAGSKRALYFAAGINGESDGLFGRIRPVKKSVSAPAPNPNPNPNPNPYDLRSLFVDSLFDEDIEEAHDDEMLVELTRSV